MGLNQKGEMSSDTATIHVDHVVAAYEHAVQSCSWRVTRLRHVSTPRSHARGTMQPGPMPGQWHCRRLHTPSSAHLHRGVQQQQVQQLHADVQV